MTIILAQFQLIAPRPAPLPEPPLLESLLFERPFLLPIILVILGIVLFMALRRLDHPRAALAALIIAPALGLAAHLTSRTITTPRETVANLTRSLISAATAADTATLASLLRSDLLLTIPPSGHSLSRQALLDRLPADMSGPYRLRSHTIGTLAATLDGPDTARSQVQLTVVPETTGFPLESWWLITWTRDSTNSWSARQITAQHIDGLSSSR
ncbi:MAG: hypothetical protein ACK5XO_01270 [Phycisphaerales bacterium]